MQKMINSNFKIMHNNKNYNFKIKKTDKCTFSTPNLNIGIICKNDDSICKKKNFKINIYELISFYKKNVENKNSLQDNNKITLKIKEMLEMQQNSKDRHNDALSIFIFVLIEHQFLNNHPNFRETVKKKLKDLIIYQCTDITYKKYLVICYLLIFSLDIIFITNYKESNYDISTLEIDYLLDNI
jgi:hypothetical protein